MRKIEVRLLTLDTIKKEKDALLFALTKDDILEAKSFAQEDDRLRSYGSSYFKNVYLPIGEMKYNPYGKPYKDGEHFSISHSGGYVAFAKAEEEIGIDIEKIREANPRLREYLKHAPIQSNEDIFHYWTLKESLAKCIGIGINEEFKGIPASEGKITYKNHLYFAKSIKIEGYYLAITLEGENDFEVSVSLERRIRTYR